jgi:hypothetical protein
VKRNYQEQVDYFAVFCRDNRRSYLIPIDALRMKWQASLRLEAARNNQQNGIRFASDYEIGSRA